MAKATRKKKEPVTVQQSPAQQPDTNTQEQQPVTGNGILEQKGITVQDGKPVEEAKPDPVPAGQEPAPATVTLELIVAQYKVGLTKLRYQEALQGFASLQVTEDTMAIVQEKLKGGRGLIRKMDDLKSELKEKALAECRMWDNAFRSLVTPLEDLLAKIQVDLNRVAQEQARKAEVARKEEARKTNIKTAIDNFILEQSQAIAAAKDDTELVRIQKLIGSAKANKSRYEEFLPDLVERCNALNPLINTQKDAIRELRDLEEQKKAAEAKGDDAALIAIEDKKEALNATVEEQKVLIQEEAISQAVRPGTVEVGRPVFNTVKARRSKWLGELKTDDKSMKAAFNAGLLTCTLNKEKVQLLIDTLEQTKQLDGLEVFEINGIKLYLEVRY